MNIESILTKIKTFQELVIDSGFKRDVIDYQNSINQAQNQNLVFMKGLSEKVKDNFEIFENYSLNEELQSVLKKNKPFTSLNTLEELKELDKNIEINGQQYFPKLINIFKKLNQAITANETEINEVKTIFKLYASETKETDTGEEQVLTAVRNDTKSAV